MGPGNSSSRGIQRYISSSLRVISGDTGAKAEEEKTEEATSPTLTPAPVSASISAPEETPTGTGLLQWRDLPSGKNLINSKAQPQSNNPHATACPVPLTADVIFELDED